ncbi:MAG: Succinate dehydrogenase iron-sulfur protein, partial [uncultured Solirubrobacteraceae bacterium]
GGRHAVHGVHPVRRLRVGLPLHGGRPALHRPGRAGQGLPLRGRPPRRPAARAPEGPRRGPARHVRLHALLQVHRGVPQGRLPDEPDHAPAPARGRRSPHRGPQQRLPPREGVRQEHLQERPAPRGRPAAGLLRRQVPPARGPRAAGLAAGDHEGAPAPQGHAGEGAAAPAQGAEGRQGDLRPDREPPRARRAEPVHRRLRRGRRRGQGAQRLRGGRRRRGRRDGVGPRRVSPREGL